ncbi:hypothetical protein ACFO3O_21430 [Dokdonia ponticola]|uniref:Cyclic lactone autoinducer peptide n=1 Tax=Dokdonia ponticola TaxID=2041041 RepID=A0ABV9I237_9FLAO|nr:hypothetical protein [uncultured Dokdonia sp.]
MNDKKGNTFLNAIFGLFMIASIVKVSMDVCEKFKKRNDGLKKE